MLETGNRVRGSLSRRFVFLSGFDGIEGLLMASMIPGNHFRDVDDFVRVDRCEQFGVDCDGWL